MKAGSVRMQRLDSQTQRFKLSLLLLFSVLMSSHRGPHLWQIDSARSAQFSAPTKALRSLVYNLGLRLYTKKKN